MANHARHRRSRQLSAAVAAAVAILVAVVTVVPDSSTPASAAVRWVTGWSASPMTKGTASKDYAGFSDTSFRNIVRMGASGPRIRVRFSNVYGDRPLKITAANVAVRSSGAEINAGSKRALRFRGQRTVTIPAGRELFSDPVDFEVRPSQVLAVSLHTPGRTGRPTWHERAMATSYISRGSNRANQNGGGGWQRTNSWHFVTGINVLSNQNRGTIVAIGDSLTDGFGSAKNTNTRYPDFLSRRMQALPPGQRFTVANAGISGNALLGDGFGKKRGQERAGKRLSRDVFGQTGVAGFVILLGTNDLGPYGSGPSGGKATVNDFRRAYGVIAQRADKEGLPVVVGTIPPSRAIDDRVRRQVNDWLRRSTQFDGLADFDALLKDPNAPGRLRPDLDSGDGIHPNSKGYKEMARAVPTGVFTGR